MNEKKNWKDFFLSYAESIGNDMGHFAKWFVLATVIAVEVGAISSGFAHVLTFVTTFRQENSWMFYLLPVMGLVIVFLYDKYGKDDGGVNQVFERVKEKDDVSILAAPLIFVATALTHLAGGSAGREGAAIQLGGSLANQLARILPLDEEDRHVVVMCGMTSAFAALFRTPMAAAIFSMEVISVGTMYYSALMPCMVSGIIATGVAKHLGVHDEAFHVIEIPEFTVVAGVKTAVLAVACAAVSILFCILLKQTGKWYSQYLKNKYIRVVVASLLVIGITTILQTTDYMGAGANLIVGAVDEGKAETFAFLWKMILTALTMKAGFKGGEIVPAFSIGATFGCIFGPLVGLPASLSASCGMVAVFCGVTNCPLTSILIAFELFGYGGIGFYVFAVAISYATSGYYSLYKTQTIVYSKYKAKFVNKHTK